MMASVLRMMASVLRGCQALSQMPSMAGVFTGLLQALLIVNVEGLGISQFMAFRRHCAPEVLCQGRTTWDHGIDWDDFSDAAPISLRYERWALNSLMLGVHLRLSLGFVEILRCTDLGHSLGCGDEEFPVSCVVV